MGCTLVRNDSNSQDPKLAFAKDLEASIIQACNIIYGINSPVQKTPMCKSQASSMPNTSQQWEGLSPVSQISLDEPTQKPIKLYLKMENYQQTGSFKLRGAYYKITKIYKRSVEVYLKNRLRIVIASTGNHALACNYVAQFYNNNLQQNNDTTKTKQLVNNDDPSQTELPLIESREQDLSDTNEKIQLSIFVSSNCSKTKMEKLKGSKIQVQGDDCLQAEIKARQYANDQLCYYISPYNDIDIIAASATIGLEIQEYFYNLRSHLDYIFVSVGGGGLISGIALYLKYIKKMNTKIIGVQPQGNACMYNSIKKGQIDNVTQLQPSVSEGTDGGLEDGSYTLQICQSLVDDWVICSEEEIIHGLIDLANKEKMIVEGSAALAYAGSLKYMSINKLSSNQVDINCVVVLCGQNIALEDHTQLVKKCHSY